MTPSLHAAGWQNLAKTLALAQR